ncbi:uncharacterized protein [Epargyreus clarus]|uniref:uncharacterized protein n=1 Tax=Epargyreus clarus TaxID=520877 RepID=UPI003C2AC025
MEPGTSPRVVTTKRKVIYRESSWNVHQFEVWSGELVCRMVALKMEESLMLWLGGEGPAALGELALGMPAAGVAQGALATRLLAGGGDAAPLALRVAAGLLRPVFVCSSLPLDRFSAPLVERGLAMEIKTRPQCF